MTNSIYDPLYAREIQSNLPSANSYWASTTGPITYPTLTETKNTDVAIIGAGYTGLSCAIHLAQLGIKNVSVIDANHIGWGCSGRNAGFVLPGSGRLGYADLVKRFGKSATQLLHQDYLDAIELVKLLIAEHHLDVDATDAGYLKLAHSLKWFEKLKRTSDYLHNEFGYQVTPLSKAQLNDEYVHHNKAYGAIRYHNGFGVNPFKLVNGYAKLAERLGVQIHCHSPAKSIEVVNGRHVIETESGCLNADKVVFATNGYTPARLDTPMKGRILPVLTAVIVTRPLNLKELEESNFKTRQVMMDTRELKYYYRLLPDNRILFGGRGAISGQQANSNKYPNRLLEELKTSFPGLNKLTIDYQWHGWIAVSFDQMPHITRTANHQFYATGYCGSGLSFSALAGKQLADLVAEKAINSPLQTELPSFPFSQLGSLRRLGQAAFYQYGRLKDHLG